MGKDWREKGFFYSTSQNSEQIIAQRKQKNEAERIRKEQEKKSAELLRQQAQQQTITKRQEAIAKRQKEEFDSRSEGYSQLYNSQYFLLGLSGEKQVRMNEFLDAQKKILAVAHHYIPSTKLESYNTLETLLFYLKKKPSSIDDAVQRIVVYLNTLRERNPKEYLSRVERLPPKANIDDYVRIIHNLANIVNIYAEYNSSANIGMIDENFFSDNYYPLSMILNIENSLALIYGKKGKDELEDITEALTSEKNLGKYLFKLVGSLNEIFSEDIFASPTSYGLSSALPLKKKKPAISVTDAENLLITIESKFGVETDTSTSPFSRKYYAPISYLELLTKRCDELGLFSYGDIDYSDIKSSEEIEEITRKMKRDIPIFGKQRSFLGEVDKIMNHSLSQLPNLEKTVKDLISELKKHSSTLINPTYPHTSDVIVNQILYPIEDKMGKSSLKDTDSYAELRNLMNSLPTAPTPNNIKYNRTLRLCNDILTAITNESISIKQIIVYVGNMITELNSQIPILQRMASGGLINVSHEWLTYLDGSFKKYEADFKSISDNPAYRETFKHYI